MIIRSNEGEWPDISVDRYKDEPGTWVGVTRRVLNAGSGAKFESRYFEIEPGGYTSYEMHAHEHFVVVLRGEGSVRLDNEWSEIRTGDAVCVTSRLPHQFRNIGTEPFGILCVVDRDRDRPILLGDDGTPRASNTSE